MSLVILSQKSNRAFITKLKMKYLLQLIVLVSLIYVNSAAVAIALPNKDHPNKCVIGDELYDPGTYHPHKGCSEIRCGSDFTAQIVTCGVLSVGPDFRIETDESKEYPECCPRAVQNH